MPIRFNKTGHTNKQTKHEGRRSPESRTCNASHRKRVVHLEYFLQDESDERELSLFEAEERYLETDGLGVVLSESVSLGVIGEDYKCSMSVLELKDRRANVLALERGPGPRLPP